MLTNFRKRGCIDIMTKPTGKSFDSIKAFIFDLDYVLFNEDLYYYAVFRRMSDLLNLENTEFKSMIKIYKNNKIKSKDILGDILRGLNKYTPRLKNTFFEFYKNTFKPLTLYDDAKKIISILSKNNIKLGIVTNGTIEAQKSKIKCLGIENIFNNILYAREFGRKYEKPHIKPFIEICKRLEIEAPETIYIGDNPETDFNGAKRLGFITIRVLRGAFKDSSTNADIDYEIKNLYKLLKMNVLRAL